VAKLLEKAGQRQNLHTDVLVQGVELRLEFIADFLNMISR